MKRLFPPLLAVMLAGDALAQSRGQYNATLPTAADGQQCVLQTDSSCRLISVAPTGTSADQVQGTAAHDAAVVGNPLLDGCYADDGAPADVSADADAVRAWCLRNGARAVVVTAAGALVGGDATNGLDVDVTRFPDNEPFNLAQVGGSSFSQGAQATSASLSVTPASSGQAAGTYVPVRLSSGSAFDPTITVDTEIAAAAALADGAANPTTGSVGALGLLFNADTAVWDRRRNNVEATELASAARTASTNGPSAINYDARGVIIALDVTVAPGAETLTLQVQVTSRSLATYTTITTFPTVSATGTYIYTVYPGAVETTATGNFEVQGVPLPRSWRCRVVHSSTGSWTYSVDSSMIL